MYKSASLTKAEEIEALDKFIKKCGNESYLGPWLKQARVAIAWCILNDLPIHLSFGPGLTPGVVRYEDYDWTKGRVCP